MPFLDPSRPAYRILSIHGFYGPDDNLYPEGAEIYFDGTPNEEMEPLTPAAVEQMQAFLKLQDEAAKETATKLGKAFTGRPKTIDGGYAMAKAVELASIPVMGNLEQKIINSVADVNRAEVPETGKRGRGRPKSLSV